jgi:hypothetical protein
MTYRISWDDEVIGKHLDEAPDLEGEVQQTHAGESLGNWLRNVLVHVEQRDSALQYGQYSMKKLKE